MGISLFSVSKSTYDKRPRERVDIVVTHKHESAPAPAPNPDPRRFTILRSSGVPGGLVIEVQYHGCTTYEGRKVLVYRDVSLAQLKAQGRRVGLDPHFSPSTEHHSPCARFEPTPEGWMLALLVAPFVSRESEPRRGGRSKRAVKNRS